MPRARRLGAVSALKTAGSPLCQVGRVGEPQHERLPLAAFAVGEQSAFASVALPGAEGEKAPIFSHAAVADSLFQPVKLRLKRLPVLEEKWWVDAG